MSELYIDIIKELCKNGFDALLVGGPVRDILLGKEPNDFDVATNATPVEVKNILDSKFKVVLVDGSRFPVAIVYRSKEQVEVATFRTEESFGSGHKEFNVSISSTFEEDSKRRDFTFNSLGMCLIGDIIDHHNGIDDLRKKIVKFVEDPYKRIQEDPIRMIRACRFLANIDGLFDKNTFDAIKELSYLINTIPKERIQKEIIKAMKIKYASRFFYALYDTGLLKDILPSLNNCYDFPHGKHHFETVFEHNMLVGDSISTKCPLIKLTGYLHDVGKPISAEIDDSENITFFEHNKTGADILKKELKILKFSTFEIKFITDLVQHHMAASGKDRTDKSIRRLLYKFDIDNVNYMDFIRLKIADRSGNLKKDKFTISEIKETVKIFEKQIYNTQVVLNTTELKINGVEIMNILNVKPGPIIGKVLKELLQLVIDNPELNDNEYLTMYVEEHFGEK